MNLKQDTEKRKLLVEASRFQSAQERKEFWCLIISVTTGALVLFFIFNLV
ncbi:MULTISPECIES: hypothetical protein [Klebsiella]|nr:MULTISPECIES: hypothetical protein [Klebsiella]